MFIHLSLHESTVVIGISSPEMKKKKNYFMLSNNKFIGKVLVWTAPMESVSHGMRKYGGKRNKLYFLFGNRL